VTAVASRIDFLQWPSILSKYWRMIACTDRDVILLIDLQYDHFLDLKILSNLGIGGHIHSLKVTMSSMTHKIYAFYREIT